MSAANIINSEVEGVLDIEKRNNSKNQQPTSVKKGIEVFADEILNERYRKMTDSGDIPIGNDYWDSMYSFSKISSEHNYTSIKPDLHNSRDKNQMRKPPALESLLKTQEANDSRTKQR